jgi:putative serine protease PepD
MTKRKSQLTALLAATALFIGSIGTAAVFKLTGSFGTTTVTQSTPAASSAPVSNSTDGTTASSLYRSASPGVVDITAKGTSTTQSQGPFGGAPQSSQSTASGSGFVTDTQGHIVTAAHVVENATSISVQFQDGTTRTAKVLGTDSATDIAVLQVDPSGLTLHPLALGNSSGLHVGDSVAAIGDPFGYERSFSTGVVSGLDRTISAPNGFTVAHAIQTDAAINPGNSGGPMLDSSGNVVGIVDQIATGGSSSDQSSGVGFAVPSDLVKSELQTLEAGKHVQHAYIGIATSETGNGTSGALVQQVVSGGPASAAGLKAGDAITAIDGKKINGSSDVVATVGGHKPGDKLTLTISRNGNTSQLTVTLGVQPSTSPASTGG